VYDAAGLFNRVLDEPWTHGFKAIERTYSGSSRSWEENCIWYDELHPTSAMYKVLAEDLYKELTETNEGEKTEDM
jgi:lysophospholipase L1-like esterase